MAANPTIMPKNPKYAKTNALIAIIAFCVLVYGSFWLKSNKHISEPSFVLFVLCSVLLSLFIAYSHRVEELNFKEIKVTLREIKETEASIKELAAAIVELSEADDHAIMVETFDEERKRNAINNIKRFTT
jgi:hypothetical protein